MIKEEDFTKFVEILLDLAEIYLYWWREKEISYWNKAKTSKFYLNIDVDGKGTFKWVEISLKKGLNRRFLDRLGLSCFNFSHSSLELTLLHLHLSEPSSTNKLIGSIKFSS